MNEESSDDEYSLDDSNWNKESQGRVPFRGLKNQVVPVDKEGRFFFFRGTNSFNNFNALLQTSTSTTTILTTVTSTLASATVKTCAAAAQFINGAAATACRRRRYAVDEIEAPKNRIAVYPSQVNP